MKKRREKQRKGGLRELWARDKGTKEGTVRQAEKRREKGRKRKVRGKRSGGR